MSFLRRLLRAEKPLSGNQLVKAAYHLFCKRNQGTEVKFTEPNLPTEDWDSYYRHRGQMVHRVIADDSDWHRNRTGYMSYDSAQILRFGKKAWVVARGEKTGDYPGDQYASDIIAIYAGDVGVLPEKERAERLKEILRKGSSQSHAEFSDSLLVAMSDGSVVFPEFGIGRRLFELKGDELQTHIAEQRQLDKRYISAGTLQPLVAKAQSYKSSAVVVVVEGIETVLKNNEAARGS